MADEVREAAVASSHIDSQVDPRFPGPARRAWGPLGTAPHRTVEKRRPIQPVKLLKLILVMIARAGRGGGCSDGEPAGRDHT